MPSNAVKLTAGIPAPGEAFAGKYTVERVIGIGGMGAVLAAKHPQLDEVVAIKVLLPDLMDNEEVVTRFMREGRAAVKIRSEHVGRVLDVGTLDSGLPYIVMEYLSGRDLQEVLGAGPVRLAAAADYVLQACEALAQAHAAGIVHRDLKPSNLFLTMRPDGRPCIKVLDFGISKVTASKGGVVDLSMTRTSSAMGSPLYMSPEQLRSFRDVDARTDLWSLGVVLFELVTGRTPFEANGVPELAASILRDPAPSVLDFCPELPASFDALLARCLEKEVDRRFQSVAELAAALEPFGSGAMHGAAERIGHVVGSAPPEGLTTADVTLRRAGDVRGDSSTVARTGVAWGSTAKRGGKVRLLSVAAAGALVVGAVVVVAFSGKSPNGLTARPNPAATGAPNLVVAPPVPPADSAPAVPEPEPPTTTTESAPSVAASGSGARPHAAPSPTKAQPAKAPAKPTPPRPPNDGLADDRHG